MCIRDSLCSTPPTTQSIGAHAELVLTTRAQRKWTAIASLRIGQSTMHQKMGRVKHHQVPSPSSSVIHRT
eukprot:931520-Amphidinium_carterae.1